MLLRMARLLVLGIALLLITGVVWTVEPASDVGTQNEYFPLKKGNEWAYDFETSMTSTSKFGALSTWSQTHVEGNVGVEVEGADSKTFAPKTVMKVKEETEAEIESKVTDPEGRTRTRKRDIELTYYNYYDLHNGVELVGIEMYDTVRKLEEPYLILPTPVEVGDSWETALWGSTPLGPGSAGLWAEAEVTEEETIEVPAGEFECIKVEWNLIDDTISLVEGVTMKFNSFSLDIWYAKGVGLIKTECDLTATMTMTFPSGETATTTTKYHMLQELTGARIMK